MNTQTLEYNNQTGQITLSEYVDITTAVLTLAMGKIYDDNGLDEGDEVLITKKKNLDTLTKFKLIDKE